MLASINGSESKSGKSVEGLLKAPEEGDRVSVGRNQTKTHSNQ